MDGIGKKHGSPLPKNDSEEKKQVNLKPKILAQTSAKISDQIFPSATSSSGLPNNWNKTGVTPSPPASGAITSQEKEMSWLKDYLLKHTAIEKNTRHEFFQGNHTNLPIYPVGDEALAFKPKNTEQDNIKRHTGLLTGNSMIISGTFEVAEWATRSLQKLLSQQGTTEAEQSRASNPHIQPTWWEQLKVQVPQAHENNIRNDLRKALVDIDYLSQLRRLTNFYRNGYHKGERSEPLWRPFQTTCALSVLSQLRTQDRVLIPLDMLAVDEKKAALAAQGKFVRATEAHATCAVIERIPGTTTCKIHHFESNGMLAKKMTKEEMTNKRTLNGSPIQRHWTFEERMLSEAKNYTYRGADDKLRTFMRTTVEYDFDMFHHHQTAAASEADIQKLRDLIFLENTFRLNTISRTIENQRSRLSAFGHPVTMVDPKIWTTC